MTVCNMGFCLEYRSSFCQVPRLTACIILNGRCTSVARVTVVALTTSMVVAAV